MLFKIPAVAIPFLLVAALFAIAMAVVVNVYDEDYLFEKVYVEFMRDCDTSKAYCAEILDPHHEDCFTEAFEERRDEWIATMDTVHRHYPRYRGCVMKAAQPWLIENFKTTGRKPPRFKSL